MSIAVTPSRASALATADQENNPFFTGAAFSGTASTAGATEVLPASNAQSGTTFDPWTATITGTSARWKIDFGSGAEPTLVALAAHNVADLGGTAYVRHSDDDVSYTITGAGGLTPSINEALAWRLNDGSHRYWDIVVTGLTASDLISVGVIWFGAEIIMPQRIYQGYTPPIAPTQVDLRTNVSEGAQLLGSSFAERGSTFSTEFNNITPTFLRGATWQAFQNRWNQGHGSFWAWRPTKYGDLFYAWRSGGPITPTNSGPKDYMSLSISGRLYHE